MIEPRFDPSLVTIILGFPVPISAYIVSKTKLHLVSELESRKQIK